MSVFYDLSKTPRNILNQAIVRAIVSENNGALFDPSDLSTLYQDAAGTVPVTAVGQPVGLVLDKSKGLELGPELPIYIGTGWTLNNYVYKKTTAGWGSLGATGVSLGKTYRLSFRVKSITSGSNVSVYSRNIGNTYNDILTTFTLTVGGTYTAFVSISYDGSSPSEIWIDNADFTGEIDNFSVRELYGNHAAQPITASRPTLIYENGMYGLLFDGINDYLNLPYMGLYAGGACSMVAAVNSVTQATDGHLLSERSTASANQKYILSRRVANDGIDSLITNDANTTVKDTNGTTSELRTKTVRSIIDNSQNITVYKEGVLSGYDDYTRSGTLTLNTTTIGASVSTTTTNFMNFKLFGLIVTKSALNDTQRLQCEKYLGRKVNVPI